MTNNIPPLTGPECGECEGTGATVFRLDDGCICPCVERRWRQACELLGEAAIHLTHDAVTRTIGTRITEFLAND